MAKGGKGRKGGGGGGGKTRKYSRDNNGRFASTGTGATARGGRLLTAKGNKRTTRALAGKTKTIEAANQKGVLAKPKGLKPGAIKPKVTAAAKPKAVAAVPKAAKLPREQRLARAKVTAKRIDQKLKAKADETGAAFAERRRISSRASSKARTAAFEKEAVAGKASATALRASQRSNARVTRLNEEKGKYAQAARDAATKSTVKPAPKLATKPPEPAVKIAKRKPLTSAQIAAGREADRREMASVRKKPASWLAPPANKLRTRLNPAAKSPILPRTRLPGTISKNKQLRTVANRESAFQRRFGRAYNLGSNRGAGLSVKKAKSERTRGKALDLYTGRKRLDGTEATVGRFPRSRTSTGFQSPSSNIKLARRFAPGAPKPANATAKPPAPKPTIARAKPGAFRPGQLMNANAFPTNAIAKKPKIKHGYKDVTSKMTRMQQQMTIAKNVEIAVAQAKKEMPNLPITVTNQRRGSTASVALNLKTGARRMEINKAAQFYQIPNAYARRTRREGTFSSASPRHTIAHEIGHAKHRTMGDPIGQSFKSSEDRRIARRVSNYAASKSNEFVAEVRGARKVGSRFDAQIMGKYREYSGLSAKPAPRFRPTAKAKAKAKAAKR